MRIDYCHLCRWPMERRGGALPAPVSDNCSSRRHALLDRRRRLSVRQRVRWSRYRALLFGDLEHRAGRLRFHLSRRGTYQRLRLPGVDAPLTVFVDKRVRGYRLWGL